MEKDWFTIIIEPDGSEHVIQQNDEQDKNHGPSDTTATNEAKMYSIPGTKKSKYSLKINRKLVLSKTFM